MLLAGHHHVASTHSARDLVTRAGPALVVQAGTATSTRLRDEEQSFNRIDIDGDSVTLTLQTWKDDKFESSSVADVRAGGRSLARRRRRKDRSTSRRTSGARAGRLEARAWPSPIRNST